MDWLRRTILTVALGGIAAEPAPAAAPAPAEPAPAEPAPAPAPRGRVAEMAARFQAKNNTARAAAAAAHRPSGAFNTAAWNREGKNAVMKLQNAEYYRALGRNQTGRGRRKQRTSRKSRKVQRNRQRKHYVYPVEHINRIV